MKEATITLSLTKDHQVIRHNVTPVETMLLVSDHHKNVGGNPVEVHKDTVKEISIAVPAEPEVKDAAGKVVKAAKPATTRSRTNDEELQRLRGRYREDRVQFISSAVRDFPDDFDKAIQIAIGLKLPGGTSSLVTHKL